MNPTLLDQFFNEFDFKVTNGISYGIFNKRLVSITNVNGLIKISIVLTKNLKTNDFGKDQIVEIIQKMNGLLGKYSNCAVKFDFGTFTMDTYLNPVKTVDENIIGIITEETELLDIMEIPACDTCPICNGTITPDDPFYVYENSVIQVHEHCFAPLQNLFDSMITKKYGDVKKQNYFTGIIGAILGAMVGTFLYLFMESLNFFATISTFVGLYLAAKFYKKFNGKMTNKRIFIICGIMLLFTFIGEYFMLSYTLFKTSEFSFVFALANPFYGLKSYTPIIVRLFLNIIFIYVYFSISYKQQKAMPTIKKV